MKKNFLGDISDEISSFFKAIFSKNGVRNWLVLQNEIFKASDAFILPYKYTAKISKMKFYMGNFFPNPLKNISNFLAVF